eukprot:4299718-Prymnesium_polylepis.2
MVRVGLRGAASCSAAPSRRCKGCWRANVQLKLAVGRGRLRSEALATIMKNRAICELGALPRR